MIRSINMFSLWEADISKIKYFNGWDCKQRIWKVVPYINFGLSLFILGTRLKSTLRKHVIKNQPYNHSEISRSFKML